MERTVLRRRQFIGTTLAATAAIAQASASGFSDIQAEKQSSRMKLGLYSITFLGVWYRGDALKLEGVIRRAKKYGYDEVELDRCLRVLVV